MAIIKPETEIRSREITRSQDTNNPKLWYLDKLARIVIEINKKQIEVEKDVAAMQRKKKMFMCIIHCLDSQHCYIHFISTKGEKVGYVFYSIVTEFINCLTILTNLLTIVFSILFDRWLKQRWLKQSLWYLDNSLFSFRSSPFCPLLCSFFCLC